MNNRKIAALTALALTVCAIGVTPDAADAAKKIKINKSKVTIKVGQSVKLKVNVKKAKWSSSKKSVAKVSKGKVTGVSKGTAKITAKKGKKKATCKVIVKANAKKTAAKPAATPYNPYPGYTMVPYYPTVTAYPNYTYAPYNPTVTGAPSTAQPTLGPRITLSPAATVTPVADDFNFKKDCKVEYGTKPIYIEFKYGKGGNDDSDIEMTPELKQEFESKGLTVSDDGTVSGTVTCETAKFTFDKLPQGQAGIESFFADPEPSDVDDGAGGKLNYGGFNAMAANICAAATFDGTPDPADPHKANAPCRAMFEEINGTAYTIAANNQDQAIDSMKAAWQTCGSNVYKSFFLGATNANNYTPKPQTVEGTVYPYAISMYKGPYYIPAKTTINGERPETYMIFVVGAEEDADADGAFVFGSERYIDVYFSTKNQKWFSFENQFMHITANNFKKPKVEF